MPTHQRRQLPAILKQPINLRGSDRRYLAATAREQLRERIEAWLQHNGMTWTDSVETLTASIQSARAVGVRGFSIEGARGRGRPRRWDAEAARCLVEIISLFRITKRGSDRSVDAAIRFLLQNRLLQGEPINLRRRYFEACRADNRLATLNHDPRQILQILGLIQKNGRNLE